MKVTFDRPDYCAECPYAIYSVDTIKLMAPYPDCNDEAAPLLHKLVCVMDNHCKHLNKVVATMAEVMVEGEIKK